MKSLTPKKKRMKNLMMILKLMKLVTYTKAFKQARLKLKTNMENKRTSK